MTGTAWQSTYSERFLRRAIQRPPGPAPATVYCRPTDEEIAVLLERIQPFALLARSMGDALREIGIGRSPEMDALARREWPHVPLSLARSYAEEFARTGVRP